MYFEYISNKTHFDKIHYLTLYLMTPEQAIFTEASLTYQEKHRCK